MLKSILLLVAILLVTALLHAQTDGYNIPVTLRPYKNTHIYLGYYYGKIKALADSAYLDGSSTGTFKGKKALGPGIYFVTNPQRGILFEFLIDKKQQFSITGDTTNLPASIQFKNSPDNVIFRQYIISINQMSRDAQAISQSLSANPNTKDEPILRKKLEKNNQHILRYRDSIIKKYPSSLLTALLRIMKEPSIPPPSMHPHGRYDSMYAFQYYKTHYWDGVSFADNRLIRTPVLETRLDKYYADLVTQDPDSISSEADYMLAISRPSNEMFKYLLVYLVQKYINPVFMGQDAVFVHLFERYVNTGQADFFSDQYKQYMSDRFSSLTGNLIGKQASELKMTDTLGNVMPLSKVDAGFTVLVFWAPACDRCKEVIHDVDSIYRAKWKSEGVKIYAIMTEGDRSNWLQFIRDNDLNGWIHVYQTEDQKIDDIADGKPGYRKLYDVYQLPVLYLLDRDKRIVAKKLTYIQVDEIMQLKRRKSPN
jgi:hypothetical protein